MLNRTAKAESDPSLKPPKGWWNSTTKSVKKNNPNYSSDQVDKTVGKIWSDLPDSKKSEIRGREGKTYGESKESSLRRAIVATGEPDQDYDTKLFDAICKKLKKAGFDCTHREFDKYQGVYINVSGYGNFWIESIYHTGQKDPESVTSIGDFSYIKGTDTVHIIFYSEKDPDSLLEVTVHNYQADASELISYLKSMREINPAKESRLRSAIRSIVAAEDDDSLIYGVDEKNNIVYYKEFPPGSKFSDNVVQYIYKIVVGRNKGDSLGDMGFGMYYKIHFDPPLRIAEDEQNITPETDVILYESKHGVVECEYYGSEADADRVWAEIERHYEQFLYEQGIGD